MDIILVGKKSFNRNAQPHVIYCGQSRNEAFAAAAAKLEEYPFIYHVNPEARQRITPSLINPPERQPVVVPKTDARVLPDAEAKPADVFGAAPDSQPKATAKPARQPRTPKPPKQDQ